MKKTTLFINSFQGNIIFLCLFMLTGFTQANQATGYIQVKCEQGISIFLDGEFVGDTEKELGGLILKDVTAGEHKLKAVKSNYQPQVKTIKVTAGGVLVYTVKPFIPKIKITEEGETEQTEIKLQVGILIIQSLPVECEINIPLIGVNEAKKNKDKWKVEQIPPGNYRAVFKAMGKEIPYEFEIVTGRTSHLMVDFISGEVKDLAKAKAEKKVKARAEARREPATDIDGNVYQTVQIGNQVWTVTNLKVTHYRNGDAIPTGHSNSEWSNLDNTQTGAYAVYDGNESIYGYLYNWYAVDDSRNIAPEGWHVPTDNEWQTLVDYLGGKRVAGGKLKEEGTTHWNSPNTEATNEAGFAARPGGYRSGNGYYGMGSYGYFWSSTEYSSYTAWTRLLHYTGSVVYRSNYRKPHGFSVRCVRD